MLRQRKNMLDSMIYEVNNEDVESSEGEIKECEVKPPKKKKKAKKRKKVSRGNDSAPGTKTLKLEAQTVKKDVSDVINISADEYIILSDDCALSDNRQVEVNKNDKNTEVDGIINNQNNESSQSIVPVISVHFKDIQIANLYKNRIKEFITNLLSQCGVNISAEENDLVVNIFSKECEESVDILNSVDSVDNNMFIIDTNPMDENVADVPEYSNKFNILNDGSTPLNIKRMRVQTCFNCDGAHNLRDCPYKKDYVKINQKRRAMGKVSRYHMEDEQRFGHLVPGRISRKLRSALCLRKNQLPLHIYRMRLLGYPPGWIEAARIEHSGMTLFDSRGKEIAEADDEDGEVFEAGSKDKFDIKKIYDFPGFNVQPSSRYKDECDMYSCPPMIEQQSKLAMLEEMAPNAMQAYKRKKLNLVNTSCPDDNDFTEGMEVTDDPDVIHGFDLPFVPPLPDEPPPDQNMPPPPPETMPTPPPPGTEDSDTQNSDEFMCRKLENGPADRESSPQLSDLEMHKKRLLEALNVGDSLDKTDTDQSAGQCDSPSNVDISAMSGSLTPTALVGVVKSSTFGTPLINAASPYSKLPAGVKFSKDICDIINFENLPDSTGKYEQMSGLIKKVRNVVARIQSDS